MLKTCSLCRLILVMTTLLQHKTLRRFFASMWDTFNTIDHSSATEIQWVLGGFNSGDSKNGKQNI